jgi:uncharacterized RDD family membrane protein YckC
MFSIFSIGNILTQILTWVTYSNMYLPASFWSRLSARFLDEILLFLFNTVIIGVIATLTLSFTEQGLSNSLNEIGQCISRGGSIPVDECIDQLSNNTREVLLILTLIPAIISTAYYIVGPLMGWQGTVAKRVMGLKVVDQKGNRITLVQSVTREIFFILYNFSRVLTYLNPTLFITFNSVILFVIIFDGTRILFSVGKTAFHDSLSYSYVVLRQEVKSKLDKNQKII